MKHDGLSFDLGHVSKCFYPRFVRWFLTLMIGLVQYRNILILVSRHEIHNCMSIRHVHFFVSRSTWPVFGSNGIQIVQLVSLRWGEVKDAVDELTAVMAQNEVLSSVLC